MAKPIFIDPQEADVILAELRKQLLAEKHYGTISFQRTFKKDSRTATVYFTVEAWAKMIALVHHFGTEVQWHGAVRRLAEAEFEIYDILVPPHVVTGSTVTSDLTKYSEWLNELDDATFNALHFHGHSHVNMATTPSATDEKYREDVVTQLPKPTEGSDSFYIFLIFNKRHEWSAEIYDLKYNALYETSEIDLDVELDEARNLSGFLADAEKVAVKEIPVTAPKTHYSSGRNPAGAWWGGGYGSYVPPKKSKEDKAKSKRIALDAYYERYGIGGGADCDVDDEDDPTSPFYVRGY